MKKYDFCIQFVECYNNEKGILVNENNTIITPMTIVERDFSCEAPTYESARALALEFAQKVVREFYEPMGVWAAFRLGRR